MSPGDEKLVAERVTELLSKPPQVEEQPETTATSLNVAGQWVVHMQFVAGSAEHMLFLEQTGNHLQGTTKASSSREICEAR